ncbi:MAG: hypothetical protein V5A62_00450 [Haloarculaceae archaeon]
MLAGTLNQRPEVDPFPVEGTCVDCGNALRARYEDEHFHIECPECGRPHGGYPFPPGGLEDRARCNLTTSSSTGLALLDDAEVVSFYRDHGLDLNDVPFWTLDWCVTDEYTEVASEDPWRLRVTIELDGEELVATLDGALAVVGTERRPTSAAGVTDAGNPDELGDESTVASETSETVTDGGGPGEP